MHFVHSIKSHPSRGAWIEIFRKTIDNRISIWSHPSRGAWIEIVHAPQGQHRQGSRTPHGVRGLKSDWSVLWLHPSSRTPHGVRGLKFRPCQPCLAGFGRTPHGVRGLK